MKYHPQYPQSLRFIARGYYYVARLREDRLYIKVVYALNHLIHRKDPASGS
jgi:hypothetical protein